MKKILTGIISAAVMTIALVTSANAAEEKAEISPFEHNIVFTDFYNYATEYPVLLYKNVSYIPMTSSMCNELYLSIAFTPEDGLYIARGGGREHIGTERTQVLGAVDYINPSDGKVTVAIPEYPVYINGRKYDNTEYPALNFRGVTYLPLTWDIVKNEFDFDFEFDGKKLTLHGNSWYSLPYVVENNEDYMDIADHKSVYSERVNANGTVSYHHEYDYTDYYRLYTADDKLERLSADYDPPKKEKAPETEPDPRFTIKDDYACFEDTQLVKLPHWIGDSWNYEGNASAEIYDYDDTTFIVVTTWTSIALPRGTTRKHHVFVKNGDEITDLDWTGTFTEILYDGKDAWYLCSGSGETMYGNEFAEIYRYTKENGLERLSDRYENINSLEYIGTHNGKMYVFAALRYGYRDIAYSGEALDPMYSGYYIINEDLSLSKLSSYMGDRTQATLAKNGDLYVMTGYSQNNRLINLMTGEIIHTFD